jgi:hypothetical protein
LVIWFLIIFFFGYRAERWDRSSSIYLFDCESGILAGGITINMLGLYISGRVKELTRRKQTPTKP